MLCIVAAYKLLEDVSKNRKGKDDSHGHNVSVNSWS